MINVNNITSTLAKLPDQALQQYAMMHKNDPYVMSLAVSESNRRKEMRAAQGAQGGAQEQPKVVDSAVAEMAPQAQPMPEDSGIGQLPAGDMEFAGGGILAFAAGDLIPGARDVGAGRGGKPLDAQAQALIRQAEGDRNAMMDTVKKLAAAGYDIATLIPRGVVGALETAVTRPLNALGVPVPYLPESFYGGDRGSMTPAMDALRREDVAGPQATPPEPRPAVPTGSTIESDAMRNRSRAAVAGENSDPAATLTGIQQVAPVAPVAATAAPVEMDIAGKLAALKPFYKDIDNTKAEGIATKQGKKEVDFANKNVTDEKKFQEEMGEYGVGREKRLKEREGKLEKDEKSNYGLAFLEAGLAMMGGESPNAFANISKGALQGMGGYKKGLASLNDRKDKLFDAYDSLEDAKRSDKKDRFSRTKAAEAGVVAAEGRLSDNMFKLATTEGQTNAETARALATASISAAGTEYQGRIQTTEGAANRATQASIATANQANQRAIAEMPSSEQRLIGSLDPKGKGDPRRGYEEQQRIKSQYSSEGKFNMDTAYAGYISDNQAAASLGGSKLLTKSQFAAMFGPPPATANPTSVVRD